MKLLLDTSAVLHLASGTLSPPPADALRSASLAVLPPVVPWELAIKVQANRLELPLPSLDFCLSLARRHQLTMSREGLDAALLCAAADSSLIHRDPFDRVFIALANREQLVMLAFDRTIPHDPVSTIW